MRLERWRQVDQRVLQSQPMPPFTAWETWRHRFDKRNTLSESGGVLTIGRIIGLTGVV